MQLPVDISGTPRCLVVYSETNLLGFERAWVGGRGYPDRQEHRDSSFVLVTGPIV